MIRNTAPKGWPTRSRPDVLLRLKRLEYGYGSEPDLVAALGERHLPSVRHQRSP